MEETLDNFPQKIVIESCIETIVEAIQAEQSGADQLEVCSHLDQDGLTPSFKIFQEIQKKVGIPLKVMIRNKGGNFIYNDEDKSTMLASIKLFKTQKVDEFVLGALNEQNQLDLDTISLLCKAAFPIPVTIHKCIDEVEDYATAIQALKKIPNVKFILTSGGEKTALEGASNLNKMIQIAMPEIIVIAAGKITSTNLETHIEKISTQYFHGRKIV